MFRLFRKRQEEPKLIRWTNPGGKVQVLSKMIFESSSHVMIAGNTRSGKSTVLHGIMGDVLRTYSPAEVKFVLLDPKRVELKRYKDLPHTIGYAQTQVDAISLLRSLADLMERRYQDMENYPASAETPKYQGTRIYVVVDELMPLVIGQHKAEFIRLFTLLLSQAGAANIWFIVGTQAPRRDVLPGTIMLYFTFVLGLSMSSAIESRCAMGVAGCEKLPLHGKALVKYGPERMTATLYNTDLREVQKLIDYWTSGQGKAA